MSKAEHDKLVHLLKCGSLQGIDTGRLDGKCEDVIPLEDAIAIIDLVYKAESEVLDNKLIGNAMEDDRCCVCGGVKRFGICQDCGSDM